MGFIIIGGLLLILVTFVLSVVIVIAFFVLLVTTLFIPFLDIPDRDAVFESTGNTLDDTKKMMDFLAERARCGKGDVPPGCDPNSRYTRKRLKEFRREYWVLLRVAHSQGYKVRITRVGND